MDLHNYKTGGRIRPATIEEWQRSYVAAQGDDGRGVIEVEGIEGTCYVDGDPEPLQQALAIVQNWDFDQFAATARRGVADADAEYLTGDGEEVLLAMCRRVADAPDPDAAIGELRRSAQYELESLDDVDTRAIGATATRAMSPEEAKFREKVATFLGADLFDDEAAHSDEDEIHQTALRLIADGLAVDPADLAREALKTCDLDFKRWCA